MWGGSETPQRPCSRHQVRTHRYQSVASAQGCNAKNEATSHTKTVTGLGRTIPGSHCSHLMRAPSKSWSEASTLGVRPNGSPWLD